MRNKMKQLIIFLLLSISLFGQIKKDIPNGYFWSDSLYQDCAGITDSTKATSILDIGMNYDWMTITCVDTGATYDDSVTVDLGVILYEPASGGTAQNAVVSDTLWNILPYMKDSTWSDITILVDDNAQKTYTAAVGFARLVRVNLINVNIVANRVFKFYATFSRKK